MTPKALELLKKDYAALSACYERIIQRWEKAGGDFSRECDDLDYDAEVGVSVDVELDALLDAMERAIEEAEDGLG